MSDDDTTEFTQELKSLLERENLGVATFSEVGLLTEDKGLCVSHPVWGNFLIAIKKDVVI